MRGAGGETQREAETEPRGSGGESLFVVVFVSKIKRLDLFYYDCQVHH